MIIGTDLHGCTIIEPFTLAGEGSATAPLTIPNTAMRAWDRLR
jgi:hypothetical protein